MAAKGGDGRKLHFDYCPLCAAKVTHYGDDNKGPFERCQNRHNLRTIAPLKAKTESINYKLIILWFVISAGLLLFVGPHACVRIS